MFPTPHGGRAQKTATQGEDGGSGPPLNHFSSVPGAGFTQLKRGQVLVSEGEMASFGYLVVSGLALESTILADGRRHVFDLIGCGDICGAPPAAPSEVTVQAASDMRLLRFPLGSAQRRMGADPQLTDVFAASTSARLDRARRKLVALGCLKTEQRTAQFLIWTTERLDIDGGVAPLYLSRQEIGEYLGMSSETVSRALSHLRRLGLIRMPTPQSFDIPDREALEAFIQSDA